MIMRDGEVVGLVMTQANKFFISGFSIIYIDVNNCEDNVIFLNNCWFMTIRFLWGSGGVGKRGFKQC